MSDRKNVLVLCTGNSCRSQLLHGYLAQALGDRAAVYGAGVEVHGPTPGPCTGRRGGLFDAVRGAVRAAGPAAGAGNRRAPDGAVCLMLALCFRYGRGAQAADAGNGVVRQQELAPTENGVCTCGTSPGVFSEHPVLPDSSLKIGARRQAKTTFACQALGGGRARCLLPTAEEQNQQQSPTRATAGGRFFSHLKPARGRGTPFPEGVTNGTRPARRGRCPPRPSRTRPIATSVGGSGA